MSVWVLTSQPSMPPLQSARPESHTWPQLPASQDGEALAQSSGQLVLQSPQRLMSLRTLVSQPSRLMFSSPEQSSQPAAQLFMLQEPAVQVGAPLAVEHGVAQAPQFDSSVYTLVSQPSAVPPEQLPQPASQLPMLQVLDTQLAEALAKESSQSLPQAPQLASSLVVLTSQPSRSTFSTLQFAKPESQLMLQAPPTQFGLPLTVLHACAHPPQLFTSLMVCVSQPSRVAFSSAEQLLHPALQAMLQLPLEQAGAPLTVLQASSQSPQLSTSVWVLISQPLAWLPSQLEKPTTQVNWQAPIEQPVAVMLGGALEAQS